MSTDSARTILLGIDEAGYGPILGPLVVSAAAFDVPNAIGATPLWTTLRNSVTNVAKPRDGRIPILDSKKLYHRKEGIARLERAVLAVMSAGRGLPPNLRGLLNQLCPPMAKQIADYAWYDNGELPLPHEADEGSIRIASSILSRNLEATGVRLAGLWSEVLPEQHYNRLVGTTRNKAVVLSSLTLRLAQRAAEAYPDRAIWIMVDKQGARDHYDAMLRRAFEGWQLKIVEEGAEHSAYELVQNGLKRRFTFTQGGESAHLPIALASMVSKYVRELFMASFNAYWSKHVPELRPTAGYYQDGLRFLKDVRPHLKRLGVRESQLVRTR